jgi:hypothetical protein
MNDEILKQIQNLNLNTFRISESLSHFVNSKDTATDLADISKAINNLNTSFSSWQSDFTNQPWFQFTLGVFVTLLVNFLYDFYREHRKHREDIEYLIKLFNSEINRLSDIYTTLKRFDDIKITQLLDIIDSSNQQQQYSASSAFFPLFSAEPISDGLLNKDIRSGYLLNKVLRISNMSKDMGFIIQDIRRQFEETLLINKEISMQKLNPPLVQNKYHKDNLLQYREVLRSEMLGKNFNIYLDLLASTIVALLYLHKRGILYWKLKFSKLPPFRNYKGDQLFDQVDIFFETEKLSLIKQVKDYIADSK